MYVCRCLRAYLSLVCLQMTIGSLDSLALICCGMNDRCDQGSDCREERNVYYHPWKTCIAPHSAHFNPALHLRERFVSVHFIRIQQEFGLILSLLLRELRAIIVAVLFYVLREQSVLT